MLSARGLNAVRSPALFFGATFVLVLSLAVLGLVVGVLSGLASRQIQVIGLWELAAAWSLAIVAVSAAHLLRVRRRGAHLVAAVLSALLWLGGYHLADAWAFRAEQIRAVSRNGLLLAGEAVLQDTDDPEALVDFSLMGEAGRGGVLGAARVLLGRGLTVQRFAGLSRIIALPIWLHALLYGLQAALVAVIIGRATGNLLAEPVCERCGVFLRREALGWVSENKARDLARAWRSGDRSLPEGSRKRGAGGLRLTRDTCPHGCTTGPGYTLSRRRRVGLSTPSPGVLASLPARVASPDPPDRPLG